LAEQRARHARGEKYAGYAQMCIWLTAWRNAPETAWLADGPIHPQQQVLRRLDEAYKRFFAGVKAGERVGPPSFKRRGEELGIRFPDPKQFSLDSANGRIKLPKLGWVRLRMSRPVEGVLRNVSVTREGERWFVSLQVQTKQVAQALDVAPTLGIDLGLTKFAATSDAKSVEPLKALARQQRRLARYQRAVARKKKGSANRRKAVARLGNLHRKIARQRSDWLHKLTTELADRHAVIAVEDLRIVNMTASARGTAQAPGRNVRAKAGLNRGILDAAWGEFARQLVYKVQWRGGRVILVNPAYTSRTCRCCGHESAENRKSQADFACVACGHTENADVHAAKNILAAGHAVWLNEREANPADACGGDVRREAAARPPRAAPAKQEPTEAKALA
jgi:putative transposase